MVGVPPLAGAVQREAVTSSRGFRAEMTLRPAFLNDSAWAGLILNWQQKDACYIARMDGTGRVQLVVIEPGAPERQVGKAGGPLDLRQNAFYAFKIQCDEPGLFDYEVVEEETGDTIGKGTLQVPSATLQDGFGGAWVNFEQIAVRSFRFEAQPPGDDAAQARIRKALDNMTK